VHARDRWVNIDGANGARRSSKMAVALVLLDLYCLLECVHNLHHNCENTDMRISPFIRKPLRLTDTVRYIVPSAVSVLRVGLALLIILMIHRSPDRMFLAAVLGVPIVFILDAVDGVLARHLNSQTLLGSF